MGFFNRFWKRAKRVFRPESSSAPVSREGDFTPNTGGGYTPSDRTDGDGASGDYFPQSEVTESTEVTETNGRDFPFDFGPAGWLPLGGDFKDDYVDLEGGGSFDDVDWSDADYVVVRISQPGRDDYYTTIVGAFDDYDDFLDALQDWWEEGS